MNCIKTVVCVLMLLTLSACGATVKYIYVQPNLPEDLIKDCDVEPAPEPISYSLLPAERREEVASTAYNKQTARIGECNKDKKGLRDWKQKQKQIYGTPPQAKE